MRSSDLPRHPGRPALGQSAMARRAADRRRQRHAEAGRAGTRLPGADQAGQAGIAAGVPGSAAQPAWRRLSLTRRRGRSWADSQPALDETTCPARPARWRGTTTPPALALDIGDRNSVVWGMWVSIRVDLGGSGLV